MESERDEIKKLFATLREQRLQPFPQPREKLEASSRPGVYVIVKSECGTVLHVGRSSHVSQRLKDHLHGASSFTVKYLKGNGAVLREGHAYQYLIVEDSRLRALLEAYAAGMLCPSHIG